MPDIEFHFRNTRYRCEVIIDSSCHPFYVFATLQDQDLVSEFGEDITIKTDFHIVLPRRDDNKELLELRQAILSSMVAIPHLLPVVNKVIQIQGK